MIRHLTATVAGTFTALATALVLSAPAHAGASPAPEGDVEFAAECDAIGIYMDDPTCIAENIFYTIDDEGVVIRDYHTAFPREAFEQYLVELAGETGTLEEYLDDAVVNQPQAENTDWNYELTDEVVTVIGSTTLMLGDAETAYAGITVSDDVINVAIAPETVVRLRTVSVTTPGAVEESNGNVSGNTVTWSQEAIAEGGMLTATASASPGIDTQRWIVAGIAIAVIAALAAIYFSLLRRHPDGDVDRIDLEPEFDDEGVDEPVMLPASSDQTTTDESAKVDADSSDSGAAAPATTSTSATTKKATAKKPAAKKPASSTTKKPAPKKAAAQDSASTKATAKKPAAKKPASSAPKKAPAKKPTSSASKTAPKKPATTKPRTTKPKPKSDD